ncbi:MAG: vWA domain-containing protein, partial [Patescibacteria group bacterium]
GGEMCDGNSQSWAGKICTDNYTQCTDDTDCPGTNTCGVAGSNGRDACNPIKLCSNDTSRSCAVDADCSDIALNPSTGSCIAYPSARTRNCNSATCTSWAVWGACTTNFGCGNGVKEGAEQCDDGVIGRARERKDNNDACRNDCKLNVCGDGYVNEGVEQCDAGDDNGHPPTIIANNLTATYCDQYCILQTVTGGYCGDGIVNGDEFCDKESVPEYCYKVSERRLGAVCDSGSSNPNQNCDTGSGYSCQSVGVCDGGIDNGKACRLSRSDCDTPGECVAPVCSPDCKATCPFSEAVTSVSITPTMADATARRSVDLYSFGSGYVPDRASIMLPACTIGTKLTADIQKDGFVVPERIAIVFVTDLSGSMGNPPSDLGVCGYLPTYPDSYRDGEQCTIDGDGTYPSGHHPDCSKEVDCTTSLTYSFCSSGSPEGSYRGPNGRCVGINHEECSVMTRCAKQELQCNGAEVTQGRPCGGPTDCFVNSCVVNTSTKYCNGDEDEDECSNGSDCWENTCVTSRFQCNGGDLDGQVCIKTDPTSCPSGLCANSYLTNPYCSSDSSISCKTDADCNPAFCATQFGKCSPGSVNEGGVELTGSLCVDNSECGSGTCVMSVPKPEPVCSDSRSTRCTTDAECDSSAISCLVSEEALQCSNDSSIDCSTDTECNLGITCEYPNGNQYECPEGSHLAGEACTMSDYGGSWADDMCVQVGSCEPASTCPEGPKSQSTLFPDSNPVCDNLSDECSVLFCEENVECFWPGNCTGDTTSRIEYVMRALMGDNTVNPPTTGAIDKLFDAANAADRTLQIGLIGYSFSGGAYKSRKVNFKTNANLLIDDSSYGIGIYDDLIGGGTPTMAAIDEAVGMLQDSNAQKKVIVLLTDGEPTITLDSGVYVNCSHFGSGADGFEACVSKIRQRISSYVARDVTDPEIEIFTAAIAGEGEPKVGYTAHMSSNICANEDWDDPADCAPRNRIQYAYQANDADGIMTMYDKIVEAIMELNFTSVMDTGTGARESSRGIGLGDNIELPLHENFSCTGLPQQIPISLTFFTEGTVKISDIKFSYCPAQR